MAWADCRVRRRGASSSARSRTSPVASCRASRAWRTARPGCWRSSARRRRPAAYARVLAMQRIGDGVCGFLAYDGADGGDAWRPAAGFLTGAAGIGLALLAATSDIAPAWDRALLIS